MKKQMKTINQSELSAECWLIQFQGLNACKKCEFKNTDECGGKNIIKTKKNELGINLISDLEN